MSLMKRLMKTKQKNIFVYTTQQQAVKQVTVNMYSVYVVEATCPAYLSSSKEYTVCPGSNDPFYVITY